VELLRVSVYPRVGRWGALPPGTFWPKVRRRLGLWVVLWWSEYWLIPVKDKRPAVGPDDLCCWFYCIAGVKGAGKSKNRQQQEPIRGSFASAAEPPHSGKDRPMGTPVARPQAQDEGEKQTTATACRLDIYFPTLATIRPSRAWGTRVLVAGWGEQWWSFYNRGDDF
jgi:hypothetical protein